MYEGRTLPMVHPGRRRRGPWRFSLLGFAALVFGFLWLLDVRGIFDFRWEYVGPVALILLGLGMLVRRAMWGGCRCYGWYAEASEAPAAETK